jgi:hypothetical protein
VPPLMMVVANSLCALGAPTRVVLSAADSYVIRASTDGTASRGAGGTIAHGFLAISMIMATRRGQRCYHSDLYAQA